MSDAEKNTLTMRTVVMLIFFAIGGAWGTAYGLFNIEAKLSSHDQAFADGKAQYTMLQNQIEKLDKKITSNRWTLPMQREYQRQIDAGTHSPDIKQIHEIYSEEP